MKKEIRCYLCDSRWWRSLGCHPDFLNSRILQCFFCGHIWTHPYPSPNELKQLYQSDYYRRRNVQPDDAYIRFMDQRAAAQLRFIFSTVRIAASARVLDIGCAAGSFLKNLADHTPDLIGYEPDSDMATMAKRRLPSSALVVNEEWPPAHSSSSLFDLVSISHVLEHIAHASEFLSGLLQATRPEGYLFLEVPHETSQTVQEQIYARHRGLMHLHFFSERSLCRLVEKAGGRVVAAAQFGPDIRKFSLVPARDGRFRRRLFWHSRVVAKRFLNRIGIDFRLETEIDLASHLCRCTPRYGIWLRMIIRQAPLSEQLHMSVIG
jgi:2-polyprenyl-3-methyl-5-hydroxy-6-metoxy-1,4-benzoquinol methylase